MSSITKRITDKLRALTLGAKRTTPVPVVKWVYVPGYRRGLPEDLALRILGRARRCEMKASEFMALVVQVLEGRGVGHAG